jgi:hypothetical protein
MLHGNRSLLAGIVGLAAGTAAAGGTYLLRRRLGARSVSGAHERLETEVVDALCDDEITSSFAIDVAAHGPGLIELSGRVPDQAAAWRAADTAQRVPGVHTVVNRLVIEQVEQQLEATRRRYNDGEPELRASAWEGMRSGMGARRQSAETDPARPDDSAGMVEDAIGQDDRVE